MGSLVVEKGRTEFSGNAVIGGIGMFLMLVAGLMVAFATGVVETLGYESRHVTGNGLTSTRSGYSLGFNTFYSDTGDTPSHAKISQTEKGTVKFPILESGLYRISFSGSVLGASRDGDSYDLSYDIRWGIQ